MSERGVRSIPLHVDEPAGVDRAAWPVTFGVPFPRGEVASAGNVRLVDGVDAEVPLQVTRTAVWPDGSLKWGLLDFQTDLAAGRDRTLQLQFGAGVTRRAPETPLKVVRRGKGVEVTTGPLRFAVRPGRHLFLDRVWLDERGRFGDRSEMVRGAGGRRSFLDYLHACEDRDVEGFCVAGETDRSLVRVDRVTVEEAGPLRVVVAVSGVYQHRHLPESPAIVRIHAYAGKSFVKVFHTFTYTGSPKQDYLQAMGLGLPVGLKAARTVTVGGENRARTVDGDQAGVLQESFLHYRVRAQDAGLAERIVEEGERAGGWVDLSDGVRGLAVASRYVWQEYPQELRVDRKTGEVTAYLWPPSVGPLDLRRYADQMFLFLGETTAYREFGNQDVPVRAQATGLSKTHELLFYFHAGDAGEAKVAEVAAAFQQPSLAVAPVDYYRETGVLGMYARLDEAQFPGVEQNLSDIHDLFMDHQERSQWYGMLHFGDIQHTYRPRFRTGPDEPYRVRHGWSYDEGRWAWTNTEGLPGLSYFLHFLRTGDRRYFDFAEAEARHVQDVDIFQWGPYKGRGHTRHNVNHWGDGDIEDRISMPASQRLCYYLTGNGRSRDAIELAVDGHYLKDRKGVAGGPTLGAHLYGLLVRWEMTGKARYERLFRRTLDLWLDAQNPNGAFARGGIANTATGRTVAFDPAESGSAGMFIHDFGGLHAMVEFHNLTGYERLGDALVRHADYCVQTGPQESSHHLHVLAFAARATGEKKYREQIRKNLLARGATGRMIPVSEDSPQHTLRTSTIFFFANSAPYALAVLDAEPGGGHAHV